MILAIAIYVVIVIIGLVFNMGILAWVWPIVVPIALIYITAEIIKDVINHFSAEQRKLRKARKSK